MRSKLSKGQANGKKGCEATYLADKKSESIEEAQRRLPKQVLRQ